MGLLKNLFRAGRRDRENTARELHHAGDLEPGDIIKFGFAAQQVLGNRSFRVSAIDTHDLGGESRKKTLFTLQGIDARIRLAVADDGPGKRTGERIEVGLPVLPEDVERVFEREAFIDLLDPETDVHHLIERTGEPEYLSGWTADAYRQEAGHNAYYHAGDYRSRQLPEFEEEGDAFSYYFLVSDDRRFGLEVQVYDSGRTEVYLLVYLPISTIEELWPGETAGVDSG